jgi:hypothetical protein
MCAFGLDLRDRERQTPQQGPYRRGRDGRQLHDDVSGETRAMIFGKRRIPNP